MNLVTIKTIRTTKVAMAPTPLMTMDFLQCEDFVTTGWLDEIVPGPGVLFSVFPSRHQCTTIPACDNVNERKTPTAYSGIRRLVSPRNAHTNTPEKTASST